MQFHLLNEDGMNSLVHTKLKFTKAFGDAYSRYQNQVSLHQGTIVEKGVVRNVSQIVQGTVRTSETSIGVFLALKYDDLNTIVGQSLWSGDDLCQQFSYNQYAAV